MNKYVYTLIALIAMAANFPAMAAPDSVTQDLQTGDWVFTVTNTETNEQKVWRYVPRNQFSPRIRNAVRWNGSAFEYSYRLHNSNKSKQEIAFLWIKEARMALPDVPQYRKTIYPRPSNWITYVEEDRNNREKYLKQFITDIKDWPGEIAVDKQNIGRQFGWFASAIAAAPDLRPGQTLPTGKVLRPELPGIGIAGMQGNTLERGAAGDLPQTGPLADAWDQIVAVDEVKVPVLAPAIIIPVPYNAAELARRLRTEISFWPKLAVAQPDVIERLNRQFEVLIPALELNNKSGARNAVVAMLTEVFGHHKGFTHRQAEEDDEDQDADALPHKNGTKYGVQGSVVIQPMPMHRVAARVLTFDLMYLLTRLEHDR